MRLRSRHVAVALLVACSGGDDAEAPGEALTVEIFHAAIDSVAVTRGRDRLAALPAELAAAPVDVICLQGIGDHDSRLSVQRALGEAFPNSLELATDDTTKVDDPTDTNGVTPPPLDERPPCADQLMPIAQLTSQIEGRGCLLSFGGVAYDESCTADRFGLPESVWDADPERRCRSCVAGHLRTGMAARDVVRRCETVSHPLVLGGQHGMMLLSKLPLSRPSLLVLPAEGTRRAIIGATATTKSGKEVDVFCATLGPAEKTSLPTDPDVTEPYPGPYGGPRDGWQRENELQVQKLVAHVERTRGGRPAVVLGNFGAGPAVDHGGQVVIPASGSIAATRLATAFAPAIARDYAAACTVCTDNPLAGALAAPSFQNRVYLAGISADHARASVRTFLGEVVAPAESGFSRPRLPLSVQYGFRTTIALP